MKTLFNFSLMFYAKQLTVGGRLVAGYRISVICSEIHIVKLIELGALSAKLSMKRKVLHSPHRALIEFGCEIVWIPKFGGHTLVGLSD